MIVIDPITFAVIKSGLDTIVDDMAYAVMRTARSPIVRDVLDYSVTICDARGRILSQAKTVALHLGAVPDAIDVIIDRFQDDLFPGDVIVLNDPYDGGMHLPDIFMFKPIFSGERLLGFSVVIAHHCDVGGRVPGSNASDSTEIFQEGLRIAPMKLYERGVPNKTLLKIVEKNVRLPELVLGDLDAQYATCNIGEREMLSLFERHGEELEAYFDRLIDYGEELTRNAIASWPDGDYAFTDYIDGDGFSPAPIPIACKLTVQWRPSLGRFRWLVTAGERGDQCDAFVRQVFNLSHHSLRARSRCTQQCRRLSLHHSDGARGIDPQSKNAGTGRGSGAYRLPRRRHSYGCAGADRSKEADGCRRGRQHCGRHRRLSWAGAISHSFSST